MLHTNMSIDFWFWWRQLVQMPVYHLVKIDLSYRLLQELLIWLPILTFSFLSLTLTEPYLVLLSFILNLMTD